MLDEHPPLSRRAFSYAVRQRREKREERREKREERREKREERRERE